MPTSEADIFAAAFGDTEREVLSEGGNFPDLWPETTEANDEIIAEQSQVEGWDGEHLSDEEGIARAMQGDGVDGYVGDRPLQHQHELEVDRENETLRQQLAQERAAHQATRAQFDPELQQRLGFDRAAFMDQHGLISIDDSKSHALFGQMANIDQERNQMFHDRINSSMSTAHAEYGKDFVETYEALGNMDPTNPMARSIVQGVLNSPDPGMALMQLHDSELIASLQRGGAQPPFARTREFSGARAGRSSRASGFEDMEEVGAGMGDEDDIFSSAFR